MKKFINIFLAVLITLFSFPINGASVNAKGKVYDDIKDGEHSIKIELLTKGTEDTSIADQYVDEDAKLNIKDGTAELVLSIPNLDGFKFSAFEIEGSKYKKQTAEKVSYYSFNLSELKSKLAAVVTYELTEPFEFKHDNVPMDIKVTGLDELPKVGAGDSEDNGKPGEGNGSDEGETEKPEEPDNPKEDGEGDSGDNGSEEEEPTPAEPLEDGAYVLSYTTEGANIGGSYEEEAIVIVDGDKQYLQLQGKSMRQFIEYLYIDGQKIDISDAINEGGAYLAQFELPKPLHELTKEENNFTFDMVINARGNLMKHTTKITLDKDSIEEAKDKASELISDTSTKNKTTIIESNNTEKVTYSTEGANISGNYEDTITIVKKDDKQYLQLHGKSMHQFVDALFIDGQRMNIGEALNEGGAYLAQYELPTSLEEKNEYNFVMLINARGNIMMHETKLIVDANDEEDSKENTEDPEKLEPFKLGYTFHESGTDKVSTMDGFKKGKANIVQNENGKYDVEIFFSNGEMIEYFEIKNKKAKSTLDGDIKTFAFTLDNLTDVYKVKVKVNVPGMYSTEHTVDLVFDKVETEDPAKTKTFVLGEQDAVSAGQIIRIDGDSDTRLVLPNDLPNGVSLTISEVEKAKNLNGLEVAGKIYDFKFEGLEGFNGKYQLTMGVNKKHLTGYDVAIYYYDESTKEWDEIKTNPIKDGKVTATLDHFSTYGVLAEKIDDSKQAEKNDKKPKKEKTDKVKPEKVSTIDYTVLQADNDEVSAADSFFKKPATLLEKDGKKYLQFTVTNWSMVNWLQANGKDVLVIAEDKKKDTATVQVKLDGNLSAAIPLSMKITVPGLYEMEHDARLVLDPSSIVELEGEEAEGYFIHTGVAKPGDFGTNGDKQDKKKQIGQNGNPKTGDTSQIFFFTMLLIGSLGVLVVQLRRRLAA